MLFLITAGLYNGETRLLVSEGRSAANAELWAGFDRYYGKLAGGLQDSDCYGYVYVGY
jgi:hypothetical protein